MGMTEQVIEQQVRGVRQALEQFGVPQPEVLDSACWYRQQFPRSGTWEAWIWDTVLSRDYQTRKPNFAGYVMCSPTAGKANAGIVRLALQQRLPVLLWREQETLEVVTGIREEQADNWQAGWVVQTAAIGD